jgi:hypothetical protein
MDERKETELRRLPGAGDTRKVYVELFSYK